MRYVLSSVVSTLVTPLCSRRGGGVDRRGRDKCGSSYTPHPSLPGHTGVLGHGAPPGGLQAVGLGFAWSFPCSSSEGEGCSIPTARPHYLSVTLRAGGQGLPRELSPPQLPGCLSQRTPIKGTNWTAIHQSLSLRPAPWSSGGPVGRLLF